MNQTPGLSPAAPASITAAPEWRISRTMCALADAERHLGHAMLVGRRWLAFDATRFNDELNGFRSLGTFAGVAAAKQAVEQSLHIQPAAHRESA
jgi:hypothetical protein